MKRLLVSCRLAQCFAVCSTEPYYYRSLERCCGSHADSMQLAKYCEINPGRGSGTPTSKWQFRDWALFGVPATKARIGGIG